MRMRALAAGFLTAVATLGPVAAEPAAAAPAARAAIDTSTRAGVRAAYKNVLEPALAVPIGWTGSAATCNPGAPSAAAQEATLTAVNWFRDIAGLEPVTFDAGYSAEAQAAALIMEAENSLDHSPPSTWDCWTQAGSDGAGKSNLALGASGARAIGLYMDDPGGGNEVVGHRRWILYPPQSVMGSGSTARANALYVFGGRDNTRTGPDWVPWPTAGYFPVQLEPGGRWSLSAPGTTNFSSATVTVMRGTTSLPVTVHPVQNGYGSNTLSWQVNPGYTTGQKDQRYDVTVSGIVRGGLTVSHSYSVTLFDADIDADQTISFAALPARTYGDPASSLSATASSGLPVSFSSGTPSVCQVSGTTLTIAAAGTCTVHADQAGDDIRNPAPRVTRSFGIAKRALTVRPADAARGVGEANPAFVPTYSGFAYGQTLATSGVTGSPSCTTTATAESPAGSYPITCTAGTLASANYTFAFAAGTLTVGGGYVAVLPARLMDTRPGRTTVDGVSAGGGALGAGATRELTVVGRGGVPAAGVGAVVLNVTAVAPSAGTFLTVWPTGVARPNASNLNPARGVTTPNLVVVQVGTGGKVSLFNALGSTHLLVDVVGWFPAGESFGPVVPARLMDTRPGRTTVDGVSAGGGALGAGATRELTVAGRGGVPVSGAGAVVLNVTAVAPTAGTFLTAWPTGVARPNASNLNPPAGVTTANLVVVQVGTGGKVSLFNALGSAHVLVDVVGWLPAGESFGALVPARLMDTRPGRTTVDGVSAGGGASGAGVTRELTVVGRGGVPASGVGAVVLNVTAVSPTADSFVTAWPTGVARPNASNLNPARGVTAANLVVVKVGAGGQVSLFNALGSTHLLVDVVGWFPPS